jgi:hypothetical protein
LRGSDQQGGFVEPALFSLIPPSPAFISFLLTGHSNVSPTQRIASKKSSSVDVGLGEEVGKTHSECRRRDEIPFDASLKTAGKRRKKKDGLVLLQSRLLSSAMQPISLILRTIRRDPQIDLSQWMISGVETADGMIGLCVINSKLIASSLGREVLACCSEITMHYA